MLCELCGRPAHTHSVTLYQNIGMIVALRYYTLKGSFCRSCITHYFWEYTLVTLALGWWGIISFFLTPLILVNNIFFMLRSHLAQQRPNLVVAPEPLSTTPAACPRCQAFRASPIGPSRSVWASLFVWAGYLSMLVMQQRTSSDNWVVVGIFVLIDLLVALCLVMLLRKPLQRCEQCHATWPAASGM